MQDRNFHMSEHRRSGLLTEGCIYTFLPSNRANKLLSFRTKLKEKINLQGRDSLSSLLYNRSTNYNAW